MGADGAKFETYENWGKNAVAGISRRMGVSEELVKRAMLDADEIDFVGDCRGLSSLIRAGSIKDRWILTRIDELRRSAGNC